MLRRWASVEECARLSAFLVINVFIVCSLSLCADGSSQFFVVSSISKISATRSWTCTLRPSSRFPMGGWGRGRTPHHLPSCPPRPHCWPRRPRLRPALDHPDQLRCVNRLSVFDVVFYVWVAAFSTDTGWSCVFQPSARDDSKATSKNKCYFSFSSFIR